MKDDEKRGSVFWAKTGTAPVAEGAAKTPWLPLQLHCLDVAAVAWVLLDRFGNPPWAHELMLDTATLAAWVGLHDYGKATPGFQAKWPQGKMLVAQAGFSFRPPQVLAQDRHDLATAALLVREAAFSEALACILGGHHGYLVRSGERKNSAPRGEAPEWRAARRAVLHGYLAAQGLAEAALPDGAALETRLDAALWLAGLVSVADWIGSNSQVFPARTGIKGFGAITYRTIFPCRFTRRTNPCAALCARNAPRRP